MVETLAALDSTRLRITQGYAQWPNISTKPKIPEAHVYNIKIKLRGIHHQPGVIRAAASTTFITVTLAIATIFSLRDNPPATAENIHREPVA